VFVARHDGGGAREGVPQAGQDHVRVLAGEGSDVGELRHHRFDEADDVLSVGVVVRVVAVDARDLLPGEIFDGGEWGFTADLEDRFEDGSGASVEEFDVALSPPSLEAVEDAVLEQRGGGLEPCERGSRFRSPAQRPATIFVPRAVRNSAAIAQR
jgi:hypothetical protein